MITSSEPWPDARLEALRGQGDDEIDDLLKPLGGLTNDEIIELFHSFVRNQLELEPDRWPEELLTWWNNRESRPSWVDDQKIAQAVEFWERWLPELLAMYLLDSLPTAYAGAKGALVLSRISLLGAPKSLLRRVLETLLFVLRVNERGGLDPGGQGEKLARKTRVFHGLVRVMITRFQVDVWKVGKIGEPWNCAANGVPVNQEDLLGTLWTFAITPIQRLERAGVTIADADKDAVVHLWCVVGHLLGIEPSSSLPMSYAEAEHCWARIQEHQFAESEEGKRLTEALMDRCRELVGVPGLRGLPRAAIYDHLGPEVARCVGVTKPGPIRYVVAASNQLFRISLRIPGGTVLRKPLRHFLKRFVGEWLRSERSEGRPPITLPEAQHRRLKPLYVGPKARREFPAGSALGAGSSEIGSRAP